MDFGKISLLLGNNDGTLQPYSQFLAGPPSAMSAADLDGDGALDLVANNAFDPTVMLFFNLGGSRVSLISSENPSHSGEVVTFTARVTPTFGVATPTGKVKFFDGNKALGNGVLHGNKATLKRSTLTVGKHQITAKYVGDTTFVPTRSNKLIQKVLPNQ